MLRVKPRSSAASASGPSTHPTIETSPPNSWCMTSIACDPIVHAAAAERVGNSEGFQA